jgi:hypothetical protein
MRCPCHSYTLTLHPIRRFLDLSSILTQYLLFYFIQNPEIMPEILDHDPLDIIFKTHAKG